jgi:uncharacterized membrane protein YeiH
VSVGLAIVSVIAEDPVTDLLSTQPTLPDWLPYAAVGFGAVAGAAFAARRGFDVIGVLGLAVAQGMGGLLLMAILLQTGTPAVLTDGWYLIIVAGAGALGFFFAGLMARAVQSAVILDALSLGLLCEIGTLSAQQSGLDAVPAVFIGVMTAVGGLILRDIMAGRAPEVLRPGIYVTLAALIGSILFVTLVHFNASLPFAQLATLIVVAAIRLLSVQFGWETHEATDFSDRVWRFWRKPPPESDLGPMTQYFDRSDP